MKRISWVFIFLLASCSIELRKPDAPDDLIPEQKMALMLEEIMVLEYHLQSRYPRPEQFQECMKRSGDGILKQQGYSYERFERSYTWYASDQSKMQEIYQKVLDSMNAKMQKIQPGNLK